MPLELLDRATLASNASRYELFRASTDADTLATMWLVWAVVAELSAAACLLVMVAILCDRRARASSFNLYVVFVTLPDFLFSFLCGITCARNHARGGLYSDAAMCEFQAWYVIFGFTASPWLNACIAHELHGFQCATNELRVYVPPSRRRVAVQAACVYAWAAFIASWTLIGLVAPAMPHRANAVGGMACMPIEHSAASTLFFWLCFVPMFVGAPLAYIIYVAAHTRRHNLVSRRRTLASRQALSLALYFLRIFVVFLLMWGPSIVLIFVFDMRSPWLAWAGGSWSHLQGLIAVAMTLTKRDVACAVANALCCGCTPRPFGRAALYLRPYGGARVKPAPGGETEEGGEAEEGNGEDEPARKHEGEAAPVVEAISQGGSGGASGASFITTVQNFQRALWSIAEVRSLQDLRQQEDT